MNARIITIQTTHINESDARLWQSVNASDKSRNKARMRQYQIQQPSSSSPSILPAAAASIFLLSSSVPFAQLFESQHLASESEVL